MNESKISRFLLRIQAIFPWFRVEFLVERNGGGSQESAPGRSQRKLPPDV
jgi:hypothetical protein